MSPSSPRILELDALRGLAAVAVVAFHYTTRYDQLFGRRDSLGWGVSLGEYGVDLFFMISGFVILMTLDRTRDGFSFAWGRFSRLYPAFWGAMTLTLGAVAWFGLPGQEVTLRDALLNLTMTPALFGAEQIDGAYWSLQAELIFYLNMLLLHRLGVFRQPLHAVLGWVALSALAAGVEAAAATGWLPAGAAQVSKLTTLASLKYFPLFGVGILLYAWRTGRLDNRPAALGVAFCVVGVAIHHGMTAAAIAIGLSALLAAAVIGRLPLLRAPGLAFLGALSYPLYLVHQNIGYIVMRGAEAAGLGSNLGLAIAVVLALGLAYALHRLVERPSLTWLREHRPTLLWPSRQIAGNPG
jgi:peptidoglycan/LPS O-acetylase OafA/YrhL